MSSPTHRLPLSSSEQLEPAKHDVLCGKISNNLKHPGNIVFRDLVASRIDTYAKCVKKSQKGAVIDDIFFHLRRTGARFLRMDEITQEWFAIDLGEAREKVAHTIRDHMRKRRDAARRARQHQRLPTGIQVIPSPSVLATSSKTKKAKKKPKLSVKHVLTKSKTSDGRKKKNKTTKSSLVKQRTKKGPGGKERPKTNFFISQRPSSKHTADDISKSDDDDDDADHVIRNSAALGLASMKSLFDKKPSPPSNPPPASMDATEDEDDDMDADDSADTYTTLPAESTEATMPCLPKAFCSAPPSQEMMAELLRVAPPKALQQSPVFNNRTGGFDLGTIDTATLQLLAKQQMALLMNKSNPPAAPLVRAPVPVPSALAAASAPSGLAAVMASLSGNNNAPRAPRPSQAGLPSLATIPTSTLLMTLQHLEPAACSAQAAFPSSPILNAVAMQQQQVSSSARKMIENELIARNPLLAVLGGLPPAGGGGGGGMHQGL